MSRARVLVVEDEPSIRRFVELALEDEPVDLVLAESLAAARMALATAPAQLVIADLMLGDGSGFTLLESLVGAAGTRRVAFSAGIGADARERLAALGVHELLSKPVSVVALQQCVAATLAEWQRHAGAGASAAPDAALVLRFDGPAATPLGEGGRHAAAAPADGATASPDAERAEPECPEAECADADAQLAAEYFGGDVGLLRAYRAQCLLQFASDVNEGDRAAERADAPALRRLAHSVKSVLRMLGQPEAAAFARQLEDLAAAGEAGPAVSAWPALRARLAALAPRGA